MRAVYGAHQELHTAAILAGTDNHPWQLQPFILETRYKWLELNGWSVRREAPGTGGRSPSNAGDRARADEHARSAPAGPGSRRTRHLSHVPHQHPGQVANVVGALGVAARRIDPPQLHARLLDEVLPLVPVVRERAGAALHGELHSAPHVPVRLHHVA